MSQMKQDPSLLHPPRGLHLVQGGTGERVRVRVREGGQRARERVREIHQNRKLPENVLDFRQWLSSMLDGAVVQEAVVETCWTRRCRAKDAPGPQNEGVRSSGGRSHAVGIRDGTDERTQQGIRSCLRSDTLGLPSKEEKRVPPFHEWQKQCLASLRHPGHERRKRCVYECA